MLGFSCAFFFFLAKLGFNKFTVTLPQVHRTLWRAPPEFSVGSSKTLASQRVFRYHFMTSCLCGAAFLRTLPTTNLSPLLLRGLCPSCLPCPILVVAVRGDHVAVPVGDVLVVDTPTCFFCGCYYFVCSVVHISGTSSVVCGDLLLLCRSSFSLAPCIALTSRSGTNPGVHALFAAPSISKRMPCWPVQSGAPRRCSRRVL